MKTVKGILSLIMIGLGLGWHGTAMGYTLSMLPRYSVEEIHKRIVPLAQYLSTKTGLRIEPVVTGSFAEYQQKLLGGTIDIGFENPYVYVLTATAHEAVALAEKKKDGTRFRGIVIARDNDPRITGLEDLEGKRIAIVGKSSAGGFLSQKLSLRQAGIDVEHDCDLMEAADNKQENVVLAVFTGDADAGFIRESALNRVAAYVPAAAIRVVARTAWLPNWALSVRRSMDPGDRDKIRQAILALPENSPAAKALKIKSFQRADDSTYDVVRQAAGLH